MLPKFSAVESGKEIPVLRPDDDSVPLTSYREDETLRILQSQKQLLVVGSCSGTGKTTMFRQLHRNRNADLAYGLKVDDKAGCSMLCADEVFASSEDVSTIQKKIEILRRRYDKIVLASGGNRYTPEEQAEAIIQKFLSNVPREEIEIVIRTLKLMSRRQTIDLINSMASDPFGHIRTIWKKPILAEINPEAIADVILPELRFPRIVESTVVDIFNGTRTSAFEMMLYTLLDDCYHLVNQNDPVIQRQIKQYSLLVEPK